MAYTTASDVLARYEFDDLATDAAGTVVSGLITSAEAIIESFTGRVFDVDTDNLTTRYFTATEDADGTVLYLDEDLFAVGTDGITAGTDTINATDYVTFPRNNTPYYALQLKDGVGLVWTDPDSDNYTENAISIHGQWGYSATPPNDIVHACIRLTHFLYQQRNTNAEIDRPLLAGEGSVIMPSSIPKDVMDILMRYKKRPVSG